MMMEKDIEKVLYTPQQLKAVCDRVAAEINKEYMEKNIVAICILKGSVVFFSELIRRLDCDCTLDFMAASSYGSSTQSSGKVNITKDITTNIKGRDVLIVEDILDTGNTLFYLKNYLSSFSPSSIRICTLFDKPDRRKADIKADFVGETIENLFIVGYGLDYDEKYRNLPYVGILRPEIYIK